MKKACLVLWYKSYNYGTCLQAYGLYNFLTLHGIDCYILEQSKYRFLSEPFSVFEEILTKYNRSKHEDTLFSFDKCYRDFEEYMFMRDQKISQFIEENYQILIPKTFREFKDIGNNFDYYISGSDQMWNPNYFVRLNMLSFAKRDAKKISYAGSFGTNNIPKRLRHTYKKYLSMYDCISVRENEGIEILKSLGIDSAECVLDPTMLLDFSTWKHVASKSKIQCKKNYLLCYFVSQNTKYYNIAEEIAALYDLHIVSIPYTPESYYLNYDIEFGVGPSDFLSLIMNASFIITDSFHACVFSILFKRDFYVVKRFNDNSTTSQNSRLTTLLNLLDLGDRLISVDNIPKDFSFIKNFQLVEEKLSSKIKKSQSFLLKSII